jgi:hypothetical protein
MKEVYRLALLLQRLYISQILLPRTDGKYFHVMPQRGKMDNEVIGAGTYQVRNVGNDEGNFHRKK